jgi:hypothetical protein
VNTIYHVSASKSPNSHIIETAKSVMEKLKRRKMGGFNGK